MAIYGFGSTLDGEEFKDEFFNDEKIILGWNAENAQDLYSLVSRIKIGDIIYLKTNQPGGRTVKIKGIGEVKAIELLAAIELGKRIFLKQSTPKEKMDNPNKIWSSSRYLFYGKKQELFYCYFLDHKKQLIERKLLFMGTTNQATTHTREIFKEAYLVSASSVVCLHNHPSNDVRPSKEDIRFTKRLMEIGMLQGIPVVDHIIVGDHSYYSFYEHSNVLNI